eukprot:COSAG06_NODE_5641_length_3344_cov_22.891834_5_plen_180_part_00
MDGWNKKLPRGLVRGWSEGGQRGRLYVRTLLLQTDRQARPGHPGTGRGGVNQGQHTRATRPDQTRGGGAEGVTKEEKKRVKRKGKRGKGKGKPEQSLTTATGGWRCGGVQEKGCKKRGARKGVQEKGVWAATYRRHRRMRRRAEGASRRAPQPCTPTTTTTTTTTDTDTTPHASTQVSN